MKIFFKDKVFLIFADMLENPIIESLAVSKKHSVAKSCWIMDATPRVYRMLEILRKTAGMNIEMHYSVNEFAYRLQQNEELINKNAELLKKVLAGTWPWPYEWLGIPMEHQKKIIMAGCALDNLAILADAGVGKTFCILNIFHYRKTIKKQIDKMLVICPLSIMESAWVEDINKFCPQYTYSILWTHKKYKSKKLKEAAMTRLKHERTQGLEKEADIYIINFEGARDMAEELVHKGFDMVVVDESSKMKMKTAKTAKTRTANTSKAIKDIGDKAKYHYISTATVAPNGPEDAWSQFYFLDGGLTLGKNYYDFMLEYYTRLEINNKAGVFMFPQYVLKPGALEYLHRRITGTSVRVRAEDCLDLPEKSFINIKVKMTEKQQNYYNQMQKDLILKLEEGGQIEAANSLVKLIKLRQITSGFVLHEDGGQNTETLELMKEDDNPKVMALDDLLEQAIVDGHKAIVWGQFRHEIQMLTNRYKSIYGAVNCYGGTSDLAKIENVKKFKTDPNCKLIIAHPQSMAHGHTLTMANYSIYFSMDYSYENYYQSYKRIDRYGQKEKTFIYHLVVPNSIDMMMMKAVQMKKSAEELLKDGGFDRAKMLELMEE